MKVVILAGGFGTRISEESHQKPKPMIEIGGMPILWHILKEYSTYGYNDFIICCGYKAEIIKSYFASYYLLHSNITFDYTNNKTILHTNTAEPWKVTVVDTGLTAMTGGRVKQIQPFIGNNAFMLTYGDGLCDINIRELVKFHRSSGKQATLTAIQPGGKFGTLEISPNNTVRNFAEKKREDGGWINGGYMVLEPDIFDLIDGDKTVLEHEPLEILANKGSLGAYKYDGFWQCMDTINDKRLLEELWDTGTAPWKSWEG